MHRYNAPLKDMKFLRATLHKERTDELDMVLAQAAKFVEQELVPINHLVDQQGCQWQEGRVDLAPALQTAMKRYVQAGWMGVTQPEKWGGQALPASIGAFFGEMVSSGNPAFSMIPALTMSACKAVSGFASDAIQQQYLPKLVAGEWTGTMCMTEAHCGSDLGLITTSAAAIDDTTYAISGTKIFISAGEHEASGNIIHLVLARIKGAPAGVKGLTLFLVPKLLPGSKQINNVACIGIEEKMGIHGNPTCTMAFEGSTGFVIGRANEGIKAMFSMMNEMRLGTSLQGVGLSEVAFQYSYQYAMQRKQGKALGRSTGSLDAADALIRHADVRRMLLTQKAFAEGGRALCQYCAQLLDQQEQGGATGKDAEKMLGLLTPIAKAFLTESGLESVKDAIQVHGGHGYIRESGIEQVYRDGRISTLYEGTSGIQALDLLGRKVLGDQAKTLLRFTKEIHVLCKQILLSDTCSAELKALANRLHPFAKDWPALARQVGMKALQDHAEVGAAAHDFLMYSGYVTLGFFWLKMAQTASTLESTEFSAAFLSAKLKVAAFYFDKILPRTLSHQAAIVAGKEGVLSMAADEWVG